jgi:hypothetical protein
MESSGMFFTTKAPEERRQSSPMLTALFTVLFTPRKQFFPTVTPPLITTCEEMKQLSSTFE